jgi:hypothetical protein
LFDTFYIGSVTFPAIFIEHWLSFCAFPTSRLLQAPGHIIQKDRKLFLTYISMSMSWLSVNNQVNTWSQSEPEWNTFLAIHALKNKRFL